MKRIRLISLVVAVIVLGGLVFAIFHAREPRYHGRTLTEWIAAGDKATQNFWRKIDGNTGHLEADPDWQAASHAVKQLAPDAIPFLLNWVQAKDSPPKAKLIVWLDEHPSFHFHLNKARYYHDLACFGFGLLGNEAKPAWPVLIRWTYDTDHVRRYWALYCLAASQPDKETLLPVLLRLIHDPDKNIQRLASETFHYLYPQDAEAAGVYKMFPELKGLLIKHATTNQPS